MIVKTKALFEKNHLPPVLTGEMRKCGFYHHGRRKRKCQLLPVLAGERRNDSFAPSKDEVY